MLQQLLFVCVWPTIFWILPVQLYSSYCLPLCGLPYSEYCPFSCTAASVCPSVAYHILNTAHSVLQQLLFDPLWPTIFWILPIQLYNSYCLLLCGLPYSEHYLFSSTATAVCPCMAYHILNTVHSVLHMTFLYQCGGHIRATYMREHYVKCSISL
jgi:hypothetical protein